MDRNPRDPNGLDADDDDEACENFDYSAGGDQYGKDEDTDSVTNVINIPDKDLPDTGGPALVLPAVGLLLAAGGLRGAQVLRRRD